MKKNYLNSLLVLLMAALMFTSCKKDDEKPASNVKYDGKTYTLAEGDYMSEEVGDLFYITLDFYGKAASIQDMFNVAWIDFTIVSSIDGIQPGTYNYNDGEELSALTWTDGSFGPTGLESIDITSGVLKIEKSGSSYTVTFTGKSEDNKDVSMTFTGAIPEFTWE